MGKVVGIRRGSVYDVETVKANAKFTMTLFGANLWPSRYDSIWLTDADHCVVLEFNLNSHKIQQQKVSIILTDFYLKRTNSNITFLTIYANINY